MDQEDRGRLTVLESAVSMFDRTLRKVGRLGSAQEYYKYAARASLIAMESEGIYDSDNTAQCCVNIFAHYWNEDTMQCMADLRRIESVGQ